MHLAGGEGCGVLGDKALSSFSHAIGLLVVHSFGSVKTDPVRFKRGFGEGLLKDKFAFFEASKNPRPKRRNPLAKRPFL